jgi:hypothetical protein
MQVHKSPLERVCHALTASVIATLMAAPVLAAESAKPAASRYVPTMADYLGVYDALQAYRDGVEKHDEKAAERAFWEDGVRISVPTPGGPEIRMNPKEGGAQAPGVGQPVTNAGPPNGLALPPGAGGRPSGAAGGARAAGGAQGGGTVVWHMPLDSYIHFESATRATHYEYFLSLYPQPEKVALDTTTMPNASASRNSIAGWPGHYEDILEKRHGEWRILQRKTMINQK